ncbi:hypothetical protein EH228_14770 [Erwinia endophytica]|uniref:hypothetical protein n=1 Tax=Erwinia endophytica TaxID=1563158 RepID=UPI001265F012|nr:hypothetical protein [Erwinia endophytica]KAB8307264.1 hypothetical protein EH228_14770 [Erwinia endophytica]
MGGINQNLKATIQFGGNLSASWKQSAASLKKGLADVGKQSDKLTKEQTRLAAELKKAKLAGQAVASLKKDYAGVSREIKKTEAEQEKLNRALKRTERLERFKGRGAGLLRRGMGVVGQLGGMMGPGLAIGGGGLVAGAMGALISPAAINAQTAERVGVARSYGVSSETFNAWDAIAKQYDMNGENFGDLFEEFMHKVGEYRETGKLDTLQDAMDTLGFKAGDLAGLSGLEMFNKVIEQSLAVDDDKASYALDALFGGEASKLLMIVKQSGKSYRDLMEEQKRYTLITEAGAAGAMEGNRAFSNLRLVLTSAIAEISGQLGNELSPDIKKLTDDLAEWFRNGGISKITRFLKSDLYPGALAFGNGIVYVGKVIFALAKKLSWLLPDEDEDKKNVLKLLGQTGSVDFARNRAQSEGIGDWFDQQLRDNPDFVERVKKSYSDTHGLFSDDEEAFSRQMERYTGKPGGMFSLDDTSGDSTGVIGGWPALAQQLSGAGGRVGQQEFTNNSRNSFNIEINVADAADGRGIANEVIDRVKSTSVFDGSNSLYDTGYNW